MDTDPTHTLVDPDLQNASKALDWSGSTKPKSNGHGWRKMGRFWTDLVHMLHKRKKSPVSLILSIRFSFFSSLTGRSLFFFNPNPNSFESTQKWGNLGLIVLNLSPKHDSTVGIHMHTTNWCRLLNLSRFLTVLGSFGSELSRVKPLQIRWSYDGWKSS